MTGQPFSLIPFNGPDVPDITIKGTITRQNNLLTIHYGLTGKLEQIILPSLCLNPARRDELWKATCFELFLAAKDLPKYWEFNMSPTGDWNVYRMDAYRRIGFREETSIQLLPFQVQKDVESLVVNVAIDLNPIIHADQILEIGITAVIQNRHGSETYWALAHPASQADFHLRESFILALAG
ncbi:MAG TPA: DOMON-like domain-containing protein [Anaerolineales bacterium]